MCVCVCVCSVHGHYSLFYFDHTNNKSSWNNKVYLSFVKIYFALIASNLSSVTAAPGSCYTERIKILKLVNM